MHGIQDVVCIYA